MTARRSRSPRGEETPFSSANRSLCGTPSVGTWSRRIGEEHRLVYLVEVHGDDGWLVLTRPPATALGIPDTPEVREQEIRFHAERMLRELTEDEQ